jgi:hypothetical protein
LFTVKEKEEKLSIIIKEGEIKALGTGEEEQWAS